MDDDRERKQREEWTEHPQTAFLGAFGDVSGMRRPESVEEHLAREGAPEPQGPSLEELIAREAGPAASDFTRGALAEHERPAHGPDAETPPSS